MSDATFFDPHQRATIEAAMARIIPTDDEPGASEAGTIDFVDRYLSGIDFIYAKPDGSGFETLDGQAGRRLAAARRDPAQDLYRRDRRARRARPGDVRRRIRRARRASAGRSSAALERAGAQERIGGAARRARGRRCSRRSPRPSSNFLPLLVMHTRQGFYADPIYGGNKDRVGWKVIGFPGPSSLMEVSTPAAISTLPWFAEARRQNIWRPIVAHKTKPARADVCIIGAGASGAAAAKVLSESGVEVVGLEKGPWRSRETFGGDELANINRYNLWPDPLLNPRTTRAVAHEKAACRTVLPGAADGRRRHGALAGLAAALHARRLPPAHGRRRAEGREPRRLADHLRRTRALLREGRVGVRRLRPGGRKQVRGTAQQGYPCPPLPVSRYAEKFHKGCAALGWNSFPTPQAALSRAFNGRRPTVISAFAQQHGDPTGTRSSALNVFVPDAVKTGRFDLRPDCYVRELTLDSAGKIKSAIYEDADGDLIEQEAELFILACGAVESARLLLLSKSGRFPQRARERLRSCRPQCDLPRI